MAARDWRAAALVFGGRRGIDARASGTELDLSEGGRGLEGGSTKVGGWMTGLEPVLEAGGGEC